jgi:hypothetical protein
MQKEAALCGLLHGRLSVSSPRVLLVDDSQSLLDLNFIVMNKLDGEALSPSRAWRVPFGNRTSIAIFKGPTFIDDR